MIILGIETSCDETAVSIISAEGDLSSPRFNVLSNLVLSQIKTHEKYGGVFPALAKREHIENITPLLEKAFEEAGGDFDPAFKITADSKMTAEKILQKEVGLFEKILAFAERIDAKNGQLKIDAIAVTYGPGLTPALWVGLNVARALGVLWDIKVIPINHMEGHICSVLMDIKSPTKLSNAEKFSGIRNEIEFPAIALLISGGHTELVHIKDWTEYQIIGETKDDAVGEAFDKVARMLGLPYPGGPHISRLAEEMRDSMQKSGLAENDAAKKNPFVFPRPMIHSHDLNFSFSGLKTSILYKIKELREKSGNSEIDDKTKSQIALAFEDAVTDVLTTKTKEALESYGAKSLIIAGGVIANKNISRAFKKMISKKNPEKDIFGIDDSFGDSEKVELFIPDISLSGDNALMIALCAYVRLIHGKIASSEFLDEELKAIGNARLSK